MRLRARRLPGDISVNEFFDTSLLWHGQTQRRLRLRPQTGDLKAALASLWKVARAGCGGQALALPLIGSGLARVGLPTRQLLDIIISSMVIATKESKITHEIVIVLRQNHLAEVDLRDIQRPGAADNAGATRGIG